MAEGVAAPFLVAIKVLVISFFALPMVVESAVSLWVVVINPRLEVVTSALPTGADGVVRYQVVANPRNLPPAFVSSMEAARNVDTKAVKKWHEAVQIIVQPMAAAYVVSWTVVIVWLLENCNYVEHMEAGRHEGELSLAKYFTLMWNWFTCKLKETLLLPWQQPQLLFREAWRVHRTWWTT